MNVHSMVNVMKKENANVSLVGQGKIALKDFVLINVLVMVFVLLKEYAYVLIIGKGQTVQIENVN
jgi:hypothetical protein